MGITKQAASKLVNAMVSGGYLCHGADPRDRRQRPAVLTSRGEELLAAVERIYGELEDGWAEVIGASQRAVHARRPHRVLSDPGDGQLPPVRPPDAELAEPGNQPVSAPCAGGADRERPRAYDRFVPLRGYDFHVHLPTPDWLDGSMAGYVEAAEAYSTQGRAAAAEPARRQVRQLEIKGRAAAWDAETQPAGRACPTRLSAGMPRVPDAFCGLGSVDPARGGRPSRR